MHSVRESGAYNSPTPSSDVRTWPFVSTVSSDAVNPVLLASDEAVEQRAHGIGPFVEHDLFERTFGCGGIAHGIDPVDESQTWLASLP